MRVALSNELLTDATQAETNLGLAKWTLFNVTADLSYVLKWAMFPLSFLTHQYKSLDLQIVGKF